MGSDSPTRASRILAGWLDEGTAQLLGVNVATAARCRASVERRGPWQARTDMAPAPPELTEWATSLARVDPRFAAGELSVAVIDLDDVVVTQQVVATDVDETCGVEATSPLVAVARVTLPVEPSVLPLSSFDERAQAWVIRSRGANVSVSGRYVAASPTGDAGSQYFGFEVSAQPSRMTVGVVGDRIVLRDGHHRAVTLRTAGVRSVPVVVDHSPVLVLGTGHLDRGDVLGPRPPRVVDYTDDEVSVAAAVTRTERVVVVSAAEIDLPS